MRFTKKQLEVIRFHNRNSPRHTILHGGVRAGKTWLLIWLFMEHVQRFRNQRKKFIITGNTISSLKRNVLDEIEAVFGIDTRLNERNEFKLFGNTVACFGGSTAADYKALKGFTAHGWLGNEVTEQHRNTIDQALKRCSGAGARIFWDTNPDSPGHFIKTEHIDRSGEKLQNGALALKAWHFTIEDNEFLDPDYVEALKKSIPAGHYYDRDILGLWVSASGMIYQDFNPGIHVITKDRLPEIKFYFAGVDWGYDHPGVIEVFGEDHDGSFYLLEEVSAREKSIDWWKDRKGEITGKYGEMPFYCDTARPDYIADFGGEPAKKEVLEGISFIAGCFKRNRLYIVEGAAPLFMKEIWEYSWNDSTREEQPVKENDDAMDAARYALYTREKSGGGGFSVTPGTSRKASGILRGYTDFRGFL